MTGRWEISQHGGLRWEADAHWHAFLPEWVLVEKWGKSSRAVVEARNATEALTRALLAERRLNETVRTLDDLIRTIVGEDKTPGLTARTLLEIKNQLKGE